MSAAMVIYGGLALISVVVNERKALAVLIAVAFALLVQHGVVSYTLAHADNLVIGVERALVWSWIVTGLNSVGIAVVGFRK